jgi:hypothetical protein
MSSVWGLKARPSRATRLLDQRAQPTEQLLHHPPLLQLVDLDHRAEQLEVVAGIAREHP